MAISQHHVDNFQVFMLAIANGDVALVECKDKKTGETVVAVCIATKGEDGTMELIPLAKMFENDPFDEIDPPGTPLIVDMNEKVKEVPS